MTTQGGNASGADEPEDLTVAERAVAARVGELHDVDFAALEAVSNVYRVANAVRHHMELEVLGPDRLSWAGFTAMFVLWVWGDQEMAGLAAHCGVTRATTTGVVTTLERRGLVHRTQASEDRRVVNVGLTPDGVAMIVRLFPLFNAHEQLVTARLSQQERRTMAHLLREVLRTVDDL